MNMCKLLLLLFLMYIQNALCLLEYYAAFTAASGAIYAGYSYYKCYAHECCTEDNIPKDITLFRKLLENELFGQPIAKHIIYNAVAGHLFHNDPKKPLVMSFHGVPGTGKNFVVQLLAKALYKNGESSAFYHFYNGRNNFPLEREVYTYKNKLKDEISKALEECELSMFIFDEVDKMPEGILNVLVPFLDYTNHGYLQNKVKKNKAIYVFLSNTGSKLIVKQMLDLWQSGKKRDNLTLNDFENLVAKGAFNEKGGLHLSETIETSLIDYYVPFLPLEESHVVKCIQQSYKQKGIMKPTDEMVQQVLVSLTFGPSPHNIYSESGCKRIEQKVNSYAYMYKTKLQEWSY